MLSAHRFLQRSLSVMCTGLAFVCGMVSLTSAQTNGIQRQYWSGISGTTVANLTSNANYPNNPTSTGTVSTFEGPSNTADNYGCRYRAFIVPPTTGSYTFWIASDDNSELWLSTSSDPAGRTQIAYVNGYCNSREWTKYTSQQSSAITLQAGQMYYIDALHKDGTQNDNLAVGWQGPGITGDAERPIPGSRLRVFTGTQYTLTVSNDGRGTTTPPGAVTVTAGIAQAVTATPAAGYQFSNWTVTSGTATIANANSAATTVTLWSANATVRANFTPITYTLTVTNGGNGTTTPSGNVTVNHGAAQSISATANSGYMFSNWTVTTGTATIANPTSASTTVTLSSGNATVRANFILASVNLTVASDGNGTTTPSGTVSVTPGVAQSISATPSSGYLFANWTVTAGTATIANPSSAATTVTISASATVRANFTLIPVSLTVTNDGHGTTTPSGTVSVTPGVAQAISASAASGYAFANWTVTAGTATIANPNSATTTVTISAAATIRANFTLVPVSLTVTNDGHGTTTPSGTVSVMPGVAQSISATPSAGYTFANWTVTAGSATIANPGSAATTVTITANATIRANFTAVPVNLTVTNDGNGSTTPSGTVLVAPGVAQSISATPSAGYTFVNWTVTSGTATIANPNSAATTVTIAADATIRANFTLRTYSLTMTNDGHGTTTPSGSVTVTHGVAQSISATAASGYVFANWTVTSGTATIADPASAATTVTLTSGNATIRANFTGITYLLTVNNDGHGTTTPAGSVTVPQGVAQSISAAAASGYVFSTWTVVSGTAAIANPAAAATTVTLNTGNATILANFIALPPVQPTSRRIAISGTLADLNGNPVGSPSPVTIAVQVNLTPTADGGSPLYTETFLPQNGHGVTVENGRFVVTLGTGVASTSLAAVLEANASCFAEITILGETPDVLLPRTPVTASPYSFSTPSPTIKGEALHGTGTPLDGNLNSAIGTYYVDDSTGLTWVKLNLGWKIVD